MDSTLFKLTGQSNVVNIFERESTNLSCGFIGRPTPLVQWTFNNQSTNFSHTENQQIGTNNRLLLRDGRLIIVINPNKVISTLHIVNAAYPTHDGEYTCTGDNTMESSTNFSGYSFRVHVLGTLLSDLHTMLVSFICMYVYIMYVQTNMVECTIF